MIAPACTYKDEAECRGKRSRLCEVTPEGTMCVRKGNFAKRMNACNEDERVRACSCPFVRVLISCCVVGDGRPCWI